MHVSGPVRLCILSRSPLWTLQMLGCQSPDHTTLVASRTTPIFFTKAVGCFFSCVKSYAFFFVSFSVRPTSNPTMAAVASTPALEHLENEDGSSMSDLDIHVSNLLRDSTPTAPQADTATAKDGKVTEDTISSDASSTLDQEQANMDDLGDEDEEEEVEEDEEAAHEEAEPEAAAQEESVQEEADHEDTDHEEDAHEDVEHEEDAHEDVEHEEDATHDATSAALSSLESQVAALREKADALEHKDEIAAEDMVTLNITLHGMHKELEAACAKMKGTYDKTLNRCQLDVTDSLSQVVRKVITTKPKDKQAEDHQVTFAKHAPAVFFAHPQVRNSPTTVVLKRIFAVPHASHSRPWQCGMPAMGNMYGFHSRRHRYRPSAYPMMSMPPPYGSYGYSAPYPAYAPMMTAPGYPYPYRAAPQGMGHPCRRPNCACGGGYGKRRTKATTSSRRRKPLRNTSRMPAQGNARSVVRQHWRKRAGGGRTTRGQRGGGNSSVPCYQHQACPNNQRYLYDAQGQQQCMQPAAQGGQRFIFPTAVLPVMAPSYYPATGPVGMAPMA